MRALPCLLLLGGCYREVAVTPCTLTCDDAPCPGDLVCGSDHRCQAPGLPVCSGGFYIKAPTPAAGDSFGTSVALSADGFTLAVGAPEEQGAGAVHVYTFVDTAYVFQATLKSPVPDLGDLFGASIALSANGNVLAIGVPLEDSAATGFDGDAADNAAPSAGAVYVFARTSAQWSQKAYLKPGSLIVNGQFGASVDISADGNFVAVGSPGLGNSMALSYVYKLSARTAQGGIPMAADVTDHVGTSVALSDDGQLIIAGADLDDSPSKGFGGDPAPDTAPDAGAAHVMTFDTARKLYMKPSNTDAGDHFGISVAASETGATLVAGADLEASAGGELDNSTPGAGAVYIFGRQSVSVWQQNTYLKAPNATTGAHFGRSLALAADGTFLIVGAPGEASGSGAAYVFELVGGTWMLRHNFTATNTEANDGFGSSVAISDNHSATAIGAPHEASAGDLEDNSAPDAGAVYVFR